MQAKIRVIERIEDGKWTEVAEIDFLGDLGLFQDIIDAAHEHDGWEVK